MLTVVRGGRYLRVADPGWADPLDGRYAAEHGGRWTPTGSFPTLYLCRGIGVARAVVNHNLRGQPYGPEDLDPEAGPVLLEVSVAEAERLDALSDEGCEAVGLPRSYPVDERGEVIGWKRCQPIGQRAFDAGLAGLAARSARASGEELAHFALGGRPRLVGRSTFAEWFWPSSAVPGAR